MVSVVVWLVGGINCEPEELMEWTGACTVVRVPEACLLCQVTLSSSIKDCEISRNLFLNALFLPCCHGSANLCSHLFCSVCFRATWQVYSVICCRVSSDIFKRVLFRNGEMYIAFMESKQSEFISYLELRRLFDF